jgi:outer membrane protein insertion porin family
MTGGLLGYGVGDIDFTETSHIGTQGKEVLEDDVPLFDRYFPGGINSIRGFGERTLGPRQAVTLVVNDRDAPGGRKARTFHRPIGGSHQLILNNEILFPLVEPLNLKGVVFSDIGNAFTQKQGIDVGDLRYSVGAGVRWRSPFGPIRVEMGRALNAKQDERTSNVHFSFGGFGGIGGGGRGFEGAPF